MEKIAIIGAGPIGLYFASLCEEKKIDYTIFEATDQIGGQIVNLYPQKKFMDVRGFENQCAIEFVNDLKKRVNIEKIHFNEKVKAVSHNLLVTEKGEYHFPYIIIAVGLGMYCPRTLGLNQENECKNILYSLHDFSFLSGKRVAIFGGGDSALDWAKEISCHSDNVHLIHRRTEFRGNANTISQLSDDVHLIHRRLEFRGNADTIKNCAKLKVHLPYVPHALKKQGDKCEVITIKKVDEDSYIDIPVDYVLVNYGCMPVNTPFNYPHEGNFLKVNEKYAVDDGVYAIGDCAAYPSKLRRIEPGKKEANVVYSDLLSRMK